MPWTASARDVMGLLPPFYTARFVEIRSPTLSLLWLSLGQWVLQRMMC